MVSINSTIFRELIRRGYSWRKKIRVWDISDARLWYLTPDLSKGFLKLKKYNPYRLHVLEKERFLIKKHGSMAVDMLTRNAFNILDLGCGSGIKAESLIKILPKDVRVRYFPVDISKFYIDNTINRIKNLNSQKVITIKPFISDFRDLSGFSGLVRNGQYWHNLILLFGQTISHYDINDLLFALSNGMLKGDVIVIGNGIRKGKRFVDIDKYKVPLFNDWFIHIMHGLGFKDNEVQYNARFANGRLEAYYKILADKKAIHKGKSVYFKNGDEVIVAIQYKYYEPELKKFCEMYFCDVESVMDKSSEYCLLFCKK